MRIALIAAALIATALPAYAEDTTKEFLKKYGNGEDLAARLYLKGIGAGISVYNAQKQLEGGAAYCPPEKVGIVDTQYALIIRSFVAKYPETLDVPIDVTLLLALKDAFPCQ
jgi:hypothetical protein